jgi:hypothetical protein
VHSLFACRPGADDAQAAEDALHRFYLTKTPDEQLAQAVPSATILDGDVFARAAQGEEHRHTPAPLGVSEIKTDFAGRSARVVPEDERAPRVKRVPADWGRMRAVPVPAEVTEITMKRTRNAERNAGAEPER